jgi:hypothetical protein
MRSDFTAWLSGFLAAVGEGQLTKEQLQLIKERLEVEKEDKPTLTYRSPSVLQDDFTLRPLTISTRVL